MTVHQADCADLELLPAIELSAAERFRTYAGIATMIDEGGTLTNNELERALLAGLLWVAHDEAVGVVGFLAAEMMDGGLFIHELDTAGEHQGRGHGRALLQAAISEGQRRGLPHVALTTFADIPWNRPWYERHGFRTPRTCDLPAALSRRLAEERARWDHSGWRRCAMMLPLRT